VSSRNVTGVMVFVESSTWYAAPPETVRPSALTRRTARRLRRPVRDEHRDLAGGVGNRDCRDRPECVWEFDWN